MGTPVILVSSSHINKSGRLKGLQDFFKKIYYRDGKCRWTETDFNLKKKIGLDFEFENKKDHVEYAEKLKKQCEQFINDGK